MDYNLILSTAHNEGFDLCGVARSRELSEQAPSLGKFLQKGYHGQLAYLVRNADKRLNPALLVDGAQTVICCAVSYNNLAWQHTPRVASYALAADYHNSIRDMLRNLFAKLKEHYPQLEGRAFVDTAPLLEKAWAVEAGLGWVGRNSLLITPQFGSWVMLGELVVNLPAQQYSTPFAGERCGECRRCMESCPNGAIVASRVIDARRCISRMTVESTGSVESIENTAAQLHGWLFGCDVCQSVCPHNRHAPLYTNPRFAPLVDISTIDSAFWSQLTPERFDTLFASSAMSRGGYSPIADRLKRD